MFLLKRCWTGGGSNAYPGTAEVIRACDFGAAVAWHRRVWTAVWRTNLGGCVPSLGGCRPGSTPMVEIGSLDGRKVSGKFSRDPFRGPDPEGQRRSGRIRLPSQVAPGWSVRSVKFPGAWQVKQIKAGIADLWLAGKRRSAPVFELRALPTLLPVFDPAFPAPAFYAGNTDLRGESGVLFEWPPLSGEAVCLPLDLAWKAHGRAPEVFGRGGLSQAITTLACAWWPRGGRSSWPGRSWPGPSSWPGRGGGRLKSGPPRPIGPVFLRAPAPRVVPG